MNNNVKILVSIQGIEGGTQRLAGTKKVKTVIPSETVLTPSGKPKVIPKKVKIVELPVYESIPCTQEIKMTQEAYNYFTGKERPSWLPKKYNWTLMTKKQRLEAHLQRTCEYFGGKSFSYSILED